MSAVTSTRSSGSKLGAEPKKVALLAGLIALAIALFVYNSWSSESGPSSSTQAAKPAAAVETATESPAPTRITRTLGSGDRNTIRMHPMTAEAARGEVDPTLHLDWLDRLRSVKLGSGNRSLFELGQAPVASAKPQPAVKIVPQPIQNASAPGMSANAQPAVAPIPLKFYGYVNPGQGETAKRGFFLDGDDIIVAGEGETMKQRYRIVQLSTSGAVIEDTLSKNQQTVPLTPELATPGR